MVGLLLSQLAACAPAAAPAPAPAAKPPAAAPASAPTSAAVAPTSAPELRKVTVGFAAVVSMAPAYVALEKGYYREQGLDVSLQPLTGGTDMVTQTASGNFDVGLGGPGAGLFNAFARGIHLTIVAPVAVFKPPVPTPLVASKALRNSGEVQSIADLRGRKVSIIGRGSSNEYFLDQALRRGGLTIRDVDLQILPAPESVVALANGAIAASNVLEPFASEAVGKHIGVVLTNDYVDNLLAISMYYSEPFADTRREDGVRFLAAFYKAAGDLQPPYQDVDVEIISRYTRLSPEIVRTAARPQHDASGDLHLADLEALQRFVIEEGYTTYQEPLDLTRYVDHSFGREALQRLGR
jgi:NitT/TauT family transport system substrate-binding protein